ncbi:MAG: DNA polymerase III subunit delta [Cyclobacteriaceae bacterium]|nr:MAG: DNA polymerase III subunit delta [Cyclobacteriaceae bacterium]
MQFSAINGLEETKNSLIEAVKKGHVAHTQLFLGTEGSAHLAMAIAFATYLNCDDPGDIDSCGKCPSCVKNQKYIHPDVHYIFPVSSTDKIKGKEVVSNNFMKEWRQFLEGGVYGDVTDWSLIFGGENKHLNISKEESRGIIQKLSLKAFEGKYKIMIIWMPEYMHPSAANGLLKVLEEPSEATIFLLVASDAERILGTIMSRTQLVVIRAFNDQEINHQLVSEGVPVNKAAHLARLASGNLRLAHRLASEIENDHAPSVKEWMRQCYATDLSDLVRWSDEFHKMTKISQKGFLRYGLSLLRDTLLDHYGDPSLIRLPEGEKDFIKKFAQVVTPDKIEPLTRLFSEALFHLERNASAKMVFLDLSLTVSRQLKQKEFAVKN